MKKQTEHTEELQNDMTPETETATTAENEAPVETAEQMGGDKTATELAEARDKYLRLYSEFENFRRRTAKERIEFMATAGRDVLQSLLPVLDDFERAMASAHDEKATVESIREGMSLIQQKFTGLLEARGLKKMEVKAGDEFNIELHEAITQIPAGDEMAGKVVEVTEAGYTLGGMVVRFAKVVTGAKQ
jgi:molecular chaperone GrpE